VKRELDVEDRRMSPLCCRRERALDEESMTWGHLQDPVESRSPLGLTALRAQDSLRSRNLQRNKMTTNELMRTVLATPSGRGKTTGARSRSLMEMVPRGPGTAEEMAGWRRG
jgi:hypothetical protein